jgi:hypothetical protein
MFLTTECLRLLKDCGGNIVLTFALAFPVLIGATGLAVDSASFYHQSANLQSVADASVLAVAKEMHLFVQDPAPLKASGEERAETLLAEAGLAHLPHEVDFRIDAKQGHAQVFITMRADAVLPVGLWGENPIVVQADARAFGAARLCVLGLQQKASGTMQAAHGAVVTAPDCAVQSNSRDPQGLIAKDLSIVVSAFTCSSGGYDGALTSFIPPPQTDCPILADPLELREPPAFSGCDFLDMKLKEGTYTIGPGVYCGGLEIDNKAEVTAEPGTYVISGGKLTVANNASLRGDYVTFYFADDAALFVFKDKAAIELGAPKDGPMAGMLFFESRSAQEGRSFEVSSDSARKLLGTIYLPRGILKVGGKGKVAAASAYTVIVANRIDLDGANLVVNADYGSTDVPVPAGLGPNSGQIRLTH